ncbi:MAG: ORF6N domain-containing protein [Chthoniobacterales bacterium]
MSKELIPVEKIAQTIRVLRGENVLLDAELARLYGVSTAHLKRAVKRNRERFPGDFVFQLTLAEARNLRCQIGISKSGRGGTRYRSFAFTEEGVAMLSSVLRSERAVKVNVAIMRAFVKLREALETNRELRQKFTELEERVGKHDSEIDAIIEAIRQLMAPPEKPKREIGFHVREMAPPYRTRRVR